MTFFEDHPIIALTSDASVDFNAVDFNAPLSAQQQKYLKDQTTRDITHIFWRKQVHGNNVINVGNMSFLEKCPDADAFITNRPGIPIAIRTADCVPVFLYDTATNAIGIVHAGWKGTQAQITAKTSKAMQDKFGSKCYHIKAVIGPSIRPCCYQVGEEFIDYFPQDVKERNGCYYADMVEANRRQLLDTGLISENIEDSGICTHCAMDDNKYQYFSFRREKEKAGRMISLMMIK
jgi:polyphenol oxidase